MCLVLWCVCVELLVLALRLVLGLVARSELGSARWAVNVRVMGSIRVSCEVRVELSALELLVLGLCLVLGSAARSGLSSVRCSC